MTSRRKPTGTPATQVGWVYSLCFFPWYPPDAPEDAHRVGHYSGFALNLGSRLADHASGGVHAARLLQVQIAAGGSFRLARAERGTRDRETQLKYNGFTRRCPICQAEKAGIPYGQLGWVYILHRDPLVLPGVAAQAQHQVVYADAPVLRLVARLSRRKAARLLHVPEAGAAGWRLVAVERGTQDRAAQLEKRGARSPAPNCCPECKAARSGPGAGTGDIVMPSVLASHLEFPEANPLAGGIPVARSRAAGRAVTPGRPRPRLPAAPAGPGIR